MAGFVATILAFIALCGPQRVCDTERCRRAAQMMIDNGNADLLPCMNFYERACAGYVIKHPQLTFQADRQTYDEQIQNLNQHIADVLNRDDNNAPEPVRRARAMYRDCIGKSQHSRAQTDCAETIKEDSPRALLYLLATPEIIAERDKAYDMADYLKRSYIQIVEDSDWLDPNTKEAAIQRINSVQFMIGFTDEMIDPQNLRGSLDSRLNPFDTSSGYSHETHTIVVPFHILTFPTSQLGLEVLNYAGVGFNIAHELNHILDDTGRRSAGWSRVMQRKFNEKAQCFVNQYDRFAVPGADGKIGKITLNENIPDNVGFQVTLNAYRLYAKDHRKEKKLIKFEDYSHEKLLMLALANVWCENVTPRYNYKLIYTNLHAPAFTRVNGMVMNSRDFAETWRCQPNEPMNPQQKCTIWKDDNPSH